jgi:hypothetical protein
VLGQLRALREVAHALERAAALALRDDRLRVVLADAVDVVEPDADGAFLDRALRAADVHVGRPRLDAAPLAVAHERRRRVEAHRLRVQQRAEELGRVVMPQPRRLVCEQPERRRVRLREAEAREADELVVDHVRRLGVDALAQRTGDEAAAVRLERVVRALAAHRTPQSFRLPHAEARKRDRDLEHLVLEDDDAERRAQAVGEQRMVDGRHERRVLAQPLPVLDVRVHRLALDRPGTDERDLHGQVVEVLRQRAQQALHLRAALDLEVADGVRALDVVVDRLVVERDPREVDRPPRSFAICSTQSSTAGQHPEPEQVDLEEAGVGARVLVPLAHLAACHRRGLHGHELDERPRRDHHAARGAARCGAAGPAISRQSSANARQRGDMSLRSASGSSCSSSATRCAFQPSETRAMRSSSAYGRPSALPTSRIAPRER